MNKKIKSNKDKIPKAFLISMVLALLFWSLTKLSGEYTTVVSFPVSYVNLPQDKLIQNVALTALDIQIKSTGFRLISLRFKKRKIKLDARNLINKQGSEYYFLVKDQRATLQNQLSQNYLIASVIQDTIFLDLGLLISKKVPVVDRFNLDFKLGYHLVKKLLFTPDSILVFGPEAQINKLKHLQLEEKTFENISESIDQVIAINQPELLDKINFTTKEVRVVG
ncbi:MAG: hypothetical protein JKY69_03740, partial [Flavobacteriaceae bacterium]|nr:hypothetical protein [Flavobacteriaceae bacterium]